MPTMTFKVTEEEARKIRARARSAKAKSVSEFLRSVAITGEKRPDQRILTKDALTGILVDTTPGPIVSDEEVRAALADFP